MSVRFGGKLDPYQTLLRLEERLGFGLFMWNVDTEELQWSEGMFPLFGLKPGGFRIHICMGVPPAPLTVTLSGRGISTRTST